MIPQALTTYANVIAAQAMSVPQARVESLIGAVSLAIATELARPLGYCQRTTSSPELYQGTGRQSLFVKRYPIRSVEQILENDNAVTDFLSDPDFFARGELWRSCGWRKFEYAYSDLTRDGNPEAVDYSIKLAYTAGYILPQFDRQTDALNNPTGAAADLPPDLEEACINSVIFNAIQRPAPGLKMEQTPGGWRQEWETGSNGQRILLTPATIDILDGYRREWFA